MTYLITHLKSPTIGKGGEQKGLLLLLVVGVSEDFRGEATLEE